MDRRHFAADTQLENRSAVPRSSRGSDAPQVAVRGAQQRCAHRRSLARARVEVVQLFEVAGRVDSEERAVTVLPAIPGVTVEEPVESLHEPGAHEDSLVARERAQRLELACERDAEDRGRTVGVFSARRCRAVEPAIRGLEQRSLWTCSVQAVEFVESRERSIGLDAEDDAESIEAGDGRGSVESAVAGIEQALTEGAALVGAEVMYGRDASGSVHLEYGSVPEEAPRADDSVQEATRTLRQPPGKGLPTVEACKRVHLIDACAGRDSEPEDRAPPESAAVAVRSEEHAGRRLGEPAHRLALVGIEPGEDLERLRAARLCDAEPRGCTHHPESKSCCRFHLHRPLDCADDISGSISRPREIRPTAARTSS